MEIFTWLARSRIPDDLDAIEVSTLNPEANPVHQTSGFNDGGMIMQIRKALGVTTSILLLTVTLVIAGCSSSTPSSDQSTAPGGAKPASGGLLSKLTERTVALPAGTSLSVTVDQTLSSEQSHSGDSFDASVAEPVVFEAKTVIPKGARVKGRVVEANASGRLQHPGSLTVALTSVEVEGKSYDISTDRVSRKGASHKKRNIGIIGGTAAGGAIIGAIAGGGKGAAIGAGAGAGAGTAGAAITGKKDVSIPAETPLTFHLKQAVSVTTKG